MKREKLKTRDTVKTKAGTIMVVTAELSNNRVECTHNGKKYVEYTADLEKVAKG